jgi:hypothetical protein
MTHISESDVHSRRRSKHICSDFIFIHDVMPDMSETVGGRTFHAMENRRVMGNCRALRGERRTQLVHHSLIATKTRTRVLDSRGLDSSLLCLHPSSIHPAWPRTDPSSSTCSNEPQNSIATKQPVGRLLPTRSITCNPNMHGQT